MLAVFVKLFVLFKSEFNDADRLDELLLIPLAGEIDEKLYEGSGGKNANLAAIAPR